jgi:GxxExxY protein
MNKNQRDPLSEAVIGCAIEVHRTLGPGLLESAYQSCLAIELTNPKIPYRSQVELPIQYKNATLDCGYRIDMIVQDQLILELKAVASILPIHQAQIITYMKLSGITRGLIINFHQLRLIDGIKRFIL